jgi:hypothetical protein
MVRLTNRAPIPVRQCPSWIPVRLPLLCCAGNDEIGHQRRSSSLGAKQLSVCIVYRGVDHLQIALTSRLLQSADLVGAGGEFLRRDYA